MPFPQQAPFRVDQVMAAPALMTGLWLVLVLLAMRGSCEVPGGESGSGERRGGRGSGGRDGGRGCGDGRNILKLRRSARRRLIAIAH